MLRSDGRAGAQPGFSPQILEQSCRGRLGTIWTMLLRALVPPWCSVLGPGAASLGTFPPFPQPEQPCMPPASGGSPSTPRYTTEQRVLGKQLLVVTGEVPTAPRKPRLRDVPTCVLQRGGTGGRGRQVPSTPSASWGLLWHTGGQDHPQGQESALKLPCAGCPTPPSSTRELPGSPVPPRHQLGRGKGQKSPRRISGIPVLPALATRTRPQLVLRGRGPASHMQRSELKIKPEEPKLVLVSAACETTQQAAGHGAGCTESGRCRAAVRAGPWPPAPSTARGRAGATRRPTAGPGAGAAGAAGNAARAQQRVRVGVRDATREAARRWK